MPKAILEFNLPEENEEHKVAVNSMGWHLLAYDMDQWLRGKLKHGHEFKSADEALEATRDELRRNAYDSGLSLDN